MNNINQDPEKKKRKFEFGLVFLLLLYGSISSTWTKNNSNYISSLTVTIIILCLPLLIFLYFLLKNVFLKIKYFTNKVKLSSFISGLLSIIVVFSIGDYFIRIDKSNDIRGGCSKECDEYYKTLRYKEDYKSCKYHYNKKMNTCLILTENYKDDRKWLYDVIHYKEYGSYYTDINYGSVPRCCRVSEKKCNSEEEWNKLVKPYMEE